MGSLENISTPHVLLLPFPAQGHFPPVLFFAKKLVGLGCHVTVANIRPVHEILENLTFESPDMLEHDESLKFEPLDFHYPTPNGVVAAHDADPAGFFAAISRLGDSVEKVILKIGIKISCIVADYFVRDGVKDVATQHGIPYATYWSGSAAWCVFDYHIPYLISNGDLPIEDEELLEDSKLVQVPGIGNLKLSETPTYARNNIWASIYMGAECLRSSSWIFVNTFDMLEPSYTKAASKLVNAKFCPIGPLFPNHEDDYDDSKIVTVLSPRPQNRVCLRWLDKQDPSSVLYIAFGSMATLSMKQTSEIARGLEESGISFIWVVRQSLQDETEFNKFIERTKERSMVVTWAPQREILSHPSLCGFLTHCGWNSAMESLLAGVPMLAWPCIYDQPLNGKLLVDDWKIALDFKRDTDGIVSGDEVCKIIKQFFKEVDKMKGRVCHLAKLAAEATKDGGSSYNNLASFVQDLKSGTK